MIERIQLLIDHLRGRYEAFEVLEPSDRAVCLEILAQVRGQELRRMVGSSALESSAFVDVSVADTMLACRDNKTGRIVGCVRSTPADQLAGVASARAEYCLDLFDEAVLPKISIATRLAVLPEWRKSPASLAILRLMYGLGMARGFLYCVLSCEPGLYHVYERMGFRPLGPAHVSPSGGFRIPMVCVNHDAEHLAAVDSPLAPVLQRTDPALWPSVGVRWYRALASSPDFAATHNFRQLEDVDSPIHAPLTRGLSRAGRTELLRHAMLIGCRRGQLIYRKGDGSNYLAIVSRGQVRVEADGQPVYTLGAGEVLGKLSLIEQERIADVIVDSDEAEVLILSKGAMRRVRTPEDRAALWENLARALADKLKARALADHRKQPTHA